MKNIRWHEHRIARKDRERLLKQKGVLLWFTGLSGSGKSTIASRLEKKLFDDGRLTYVLDGDNIRHGLNSDLDFSAAGRNENIRRVGEVAKLLVDAGLIVIAAFISPYQDHRKRIREQLGGRFIEVYVKCSLDECKKRDPKGLYKKAAAGDIRRFTGISDPYEEPRKPEIVVDTEKLDAEEAVDILYGYLNKRFR